MSETIIPITADEMAAPEEIAATQLPEPAGPGPEETQEAPDNISSLIAEAEERGRIRGRNEIIAEQLAQPSLWQLAGTADETDAEVTDEVEILHSIRPDVWA